MPEYRLDGPYLNGSVAVVAEGAGKIFVCETKADGELVVALLEERDRLREALEALLGSSVYADAEGCIAVERGGCDDTEHREIVAKARAAIARAERVEGGAS